MIEIWLTLLKRGTLRIFGGEGSTKCQNGKRVVTIVHPIIRVQYKLFLNLANLDR